MENNENQNKTGKKRTGLLVLLSLLLVGSGVFNGILLNKSNSTKLETQAKLDSLIQYQTLKDSLLNDLNIEQEKVNSLRLELAMFQGENDSLMNIINAKEALIASLRSQINGGGGNNKAKLLALKDSINNFKTNNLDLQNKVQELLLSNDDYKRELEERDQKILGLNSEKTKMTVKLEEAQKPFVGPISVIPQYEKKGVFMPIYKAKKVQRLLITFNVLGNKLTNKTINKEYHIRIIDPNNVVLSNSNNDLTDSDKVISVKEKVEFDGTKKDIKIEFTQKPNYTKGTYKVELKDGDEILHSFKFDLN